MKEELKDLITGTQMKQFVEKGMKNQGIELVVLAKEIAESLFKKVFCDIPSFFPIDIRNVIEWCGIKIYETDLNLDMGFQLERVNGYLKKRDNPDDEWEIYLNFADNESDKRYVMGHEISHYLIDNAKYFLDIDNPVDEQHCIDPFFSKSWDEILSDILASFILFPPKLVLNYFKEYSEDMKERNRYPLAGGDWMNMLGQKAQISPYYAIICYQYIKIYMCGLYNAGETDQIGQDNLMFFK